MSNEKQPYAGAPIIIIWKGLGEDFPDEGYLFIPKNKDEDDMMYHIPNPQNPGGKDSVDPEWGLFRKLLKNNQVAKIIIK